MRLEDGGDVAGGMRKRMECNTEALAGLKLSEVWLNCG